VLTYLKLLVNHSDIKAFESVICVTLLRLGADRSPASPAGGHGAGSPV
jgi:hypothetical protein